MDGIGLTEPVPFPRHETRRDRSDHLAPGISALARLTFGLPG
jgi:hypothetical protein